MTKIIELETVVIRFAGDSGDGMQLVGGQLSNASATLGNDVHTFPDFPAEIRAPAGTLPGVSGFQLSFSSKDIHTSGDQLNVLVALNPAGLKTNLADLEEGGLLLVNSDSFSEKDLKKANYKTNPLLTGELDGYRLFKLEMTSLTLNAVKECGLTHSQASKCKNMFALGITSWLYTRPLEPIIAWLEKKFSAREDLLKANIAALKAGYNYALTTELFTERYVVNKAKLLPGTYRQITGNEALTLGCVAACMKSQQPFVLSGYPITPASAILQSLSKYESLGISIFQAEDEIAAMAATVGAAYGGALAMTTTSGPGFDLKAEALGLAVMTELPMVVVNVQRAGPSTGMPTKTEQADLLSAMYGRHGECPVPILAPRSPGDCFHIVLEAFRIAINYMTPVIILSDGYLATGAEPWRLPELNELPELKPTFRTDKNNYFPYARDEKTLARDWVVPGTPGLEHRIGGLEKEMTTGNISYDPRNHQAMVNTRAEKIARIAETIAPAEIFGEKQGDVLVISWGGTYGSVISAVELLQQEGHKISSVHLRHLFPFPKNLNNILKSFKKVIVAELNTGQLCRLLRAEFLVDAQSVSKVTGKPFLIQELRESFLSQLG